MKVILFIIVTIIYIAYSQEILVQQLGGGYQRAMRKQNRAVPRYYICGAGIWKKREAKPASQHCYAYCEKYRDRKRAGKVRCRWPTRCDPIPEVHHWTRINGIRFHYCHFQDWNNQIMLEEQGNFEWFGLKTCPHGQYVFGMRTKLSQRDGLAGLILLCKNMRSIQQTSEVLIFDGEGHWRDAVASGGFAVGFKTRLRDQFIYGLKMQMAAPPYIFAFNFKYQFPKNFNTIPVQIEKVVITNLGAQTIKKQIEISRQKQFQRTWQNDKGYMHGYSISQLFSQTLTATIKIGVPALSRTMVNQKKQQITESRREERYESFKFGTTETYKIGQKHRDVIRVPPCTKHTILQIVYVSDTDIPYVLQLGYSNGQAVEYENINGLYRGVATGEVETTVTMETICNIPNRT